MGLFVHKDTPHLGASPDMIINCDCHGEALVEIKCPISVCDSKLSATNLLYLEENGETLLKKNHAYYFQIQGHMHRCFTRNNEKSDVK